MLRFEYSTLAISVAILLAACASPPHPQRIIYYLHGKIIEDQGPAAVSDRFGPYQYAQILSALRRDGAEVTSEIRPADTNVRSYAKALADEISGRIASGADPSSITVIGASKGGVIAALVATELGQPGVRYVLLAACNDQMRAALDPKLSGHVLSIYERSDEIAGSCNTVRAQSPAVAEYREVVLSTGLGHGFLYRPLDAWIDPALRWSRGN